MLRLTAARRLLATLLAPWLVIFLTLPEAVHTCAMHSAPVAGAVAGHDHGAMSHGAMSHTAMSHRAGHQMEGMSGMDMTGAPHDTPASDPTHCTCPEGCCTVAVSVAVVPASLSWVRALLAHEEPEFPRDDASVARSTDVRLPFANGPPAQG